MSFSVHFSPVLKVAQESFMYKLIALFNTALLLFVQSYPNMFNAARNLDPFPSCQILIKYKTKQKANFTILPYSFSIFFLSLKFWMPKIN
ncbi:MAG: hypothetical protein A2Z38_07510 [Planctomycetes bacterium RBG_19FT_COMBO_48_8]|nr:MAG: hypothetical protein A2167_03965 [Planctomycetes bacterium RBG_13_46_10]OHB83728.1 MAG: hypothetical protein A2Z38_07510 [Planctomycetes bacterium RBG_19FT_COMBO_48_8]